MNQQRHPVLRPLRTPLPLPIVKRPRATHRRPFRRRQSLPLSATRRCIRLPLLRLSSPQHPARELAASNLAMTRYVAYAVNSLQSFFCTTELRQSDSVFCQPSVHRSRRRVSSSSLRPLWSSQFRQLLSSPPSFGESASIVACAMLTTR